MYYSKIILSLAVAAMSVSLANGAIVGNGTFLAQGSDIDATISALSPTGYASVVDDDDDGRVDSGAITIFDSAQTLSTSGNDTLTMSFTLDNINVPTAGDDLGLYIGFLSTVAADNHINFAFNFGTGGSEVRILTAADPNAFSVGTYQFINDFSPLVDPIDTGNTVNLELSLVYLGFNGTDHEYNVKVNWDGQVWEPSNVITFNSNVWERAFVVTNRPGLAIADGSPDTQTYTVSGTSIETTAAPSEDALILNPYVGTGIRPHTVTNATSSGATITADPLGASTRNDMGLVSAINSFTPAVFTELGDTLTYRFHLGGITMPGNAFGPGYRVGFDFGSTAALRYTTSFGVGGSLDFSSNDNGNPFSSGTTHILYDNGWSPYTTEINLKSLRFDEPNELDATVSLELVAINAGLYDYKMTVTYVSTVDAKTNTLNYTFTGVNGNEVGSVFHVTNDTRWLDGTEYTLSDASIEFAAVPAPSTFISIAPVAGGLEIEYQGTLQESSTLGSWTDMDPQPASPWTFTLTPGEKRFFQIKP